MAAWEAFLRAHARVTQRLAAELKDEGGVPLTWYDVLVQLQQAPSRQLRMQELADAVLLSKSGVTRLVDRMEAAGLVRRSACPDDRRGTLAELTEAGYRELRRSAVIHVRGIVEHFTSLLHNGEAQVLGRALTRIAAAAEDEPPPPG